MNHAALAAHQRILESTPKERIQTIPARSRFDASKSHPKVEGDRRGGHNRIVIEFEGRIYHSVIAMTQLLHVSKRTVARWLAEGTAIRKGVPK